MLRRAVIATVLACVLAGCDASPPAGEPAADATGERAAGTASPSPGTGDGSPSRAPSPEATAGDESERDAGSASDPPAERPARFRSGRALRTVRVLAGRIGPREATTGAYRRAARVVRGRFADLGYDVRRQRFRVPEGVSWGVAVPSGRTWNVVAEPAGFRPGRPHLLVGAHLDTVPQAPGAEDNASGVAVLLELARLAARDRTRLPVVFVAFGAEEPRGEGDALHHFGSRAYVEAMPRAQRRGLRAMVSLDRVGVGTVVPACTGGVGPLRVRAQLVGAADALGVPMSTCADNASSDHWQFEQAGLPAARLGSTPYAEYHSAADRPGVVSRAQLGRVGRVMWDWLSRVRR